jgi:uncharacterized protein YlzI (FlbEa/FlbD family)
MAFADETAGLHVEEEREAFQDTTVQAAGGKMTIIDADAEELARLIAEVRTAIATYDGPDKEGIRVMLSEKKKHGELTAELLRNTLTTLKSVPA